MFRISPQEDGLQGWFSLATQFERNQAWRSVIMPIPTSLASLIIIVSDAEGEQLWFWAKPARSSTFYPLDFSIHLYHNQQPI